MTYPINDYTNTFCKGDRGKNSEGQYLKSLKIGNLKTGIVMTFKNDQLHHFPTFSNILVKIFAHKSAV